MAGALRGPGCWVPSQFTLQPARPWSWSWLLLPSGQKPGTLTSYSPLGHSTGRVPSWLNPPTASRTLSQRQLEMGERGLPSDNPQLLRVCGTFMPALPLGGQSGGGVWAVDWLGSEGGGAVALRGLIWTVLGLEKVKIRRGHVSPPWDPKTQRGQATG